MYEFKLYDPGEGGPGSKREEVENSLRKKFHTPLFSKFAKAIRDYELLKPGDKVAVCISGGKDSMLMAKLFQELKRHDKFPFELEFVVMDPGYREENRKKIEENARLLGVPVRIFESQIFDAVDVIEKSPCYLCARMRRGYLYRAAKELGCNKIALGHHYDDVIETILMGLLYAGQFQTMMPKLHSTNFEGKFRGDGTDPPHVPDPGRGHHPLEGLPRALFPAVRLPLYGDLLDSTGGRYGSIEAEGNEAADRGTEKNKSLCGEQSVPECDQHQPENCHCI